ncbi:MAG: TrmH family RNA methyltransferase [bacterium]|nr:TrmH family RNA methyltransferase [bacterium]
MKSAKKKVASKAARRRGGAKEDVFVVLHNIRSIHNVGSIFRTADCLGVSEIILVGYTPTPNDRFGRPRKDFSKVSLGAETTIPWRHFPKISEAIKFLKERQVYVIAVEQALDAIDYKKIKPKFPVAFILGNEVSGIPPTILSHCDVVAEIGMRGSKESLNVSVAAGIALARMLGR